MNKKTSIIPCGAQILGLEIFLAKVKVNFKGQGQLVYFLKIWNLSHKSPYCLCPRDK